MKTDFEKFKEYMMPPKKKDGKYEWKSSYIKPEEYFKIIMETFSASMIKSIPDVFVESGGLGDITDFMRYNAKIMFEEIERIKKSANDGFGVYDDKAADKKIRELEKKNAMLTKHANILQKKHSELYLKYQQLRKPRKPKNDNPADLLPSD